MPREDKDLRLQRFGRAREWWYWFHETKELQIYNDVDQTTTICSRYIYDEIVHYFPSTEYQWEYLD